MGAPERRSPTHGRRRSGSLPAAWALSAALLLGGASPAGAQVQGGTGFNAIPQFPAQVEAGQTDVAVSLLLENRSTGEYLGDSFRVNAITLVPSCGSKLLSEDCPAGSRDPNVLVPSTAGADVSPTGRGAAGTACAGRSFSITLIDPSQGKYQFSPSSSFALGPRDTPGAACHIDFTIDVLKSPTIDSDPAQDVPGLVQTDQKGAIKGVDITPGLRAGQLADGAGTDETTVHPLPPPPVVTPAGSAAPGAPPEAGAGPGARVCVPPPAGGSSPTGPAPGGSEYCARGTAAIRAPARCVGSTFRVTVRGVQVARVVFEVDGKVKRTLTKPNSGTVYVLTIDPRKLQRGAHRVIARTTFSKQSATRARTLRVVFTRCSRAGQGALPAFTG